MHKSFWMRCRASIAVALSAGLIAVFPLAVTAQSSTYILGTVTSSGASLEGADVELKGNNLDIHRTTGADGKFSFEGLSVGHYQVTASKGALTATTEIDLTASGISLALEAQPLREIGKTVVVGRAPVANASGTDVVVSSEALSKLPGTNSVPNILLQLPTAARGTNGQIHLNGDHNGISYILDGVRLPESLNRVAGNEIDPSTIGFINVLEGAYPAQYGGPFAAILDIGTKSYSGSPGVSFEGSGGSFNRYEGVADAHMPVGNGGSLVLSSHLFSDGRAIDPPVLGAPHDAGSAATQFLRLGLPVGNSDFINLDIVHSLQTFQIPPDIGNGVPANTDDNEKQFDTFAALQYRHAIGPNASISLGPSIKYSRLLDTNDPANDLAAAQNPNNACGPAGDFSDCPVFSVFADRRSKTLSFNADYVYHSSRHEVRIGGLTSSQSVPKDYAITLQPGNNLNPQGGTFTAIDTNTNRGSSQGFYIQDGWQWSPHWRLDLGARFDGFSVSSTTFSNYFSQTSPRAKLTYAFSPRASIYAYYGRLFVPFSLETIDPVTAASLYVPGSTNPGATFDLKPQRDSLYETGFHVPLGSADLGFRISHKVSTDWIDDTQVGSTNLHQDINFPQGRVDSQSVYLRAPLARNGSAYVSAAHVLAVNSANCETQLLQNCAAAGAPGGDFVAADHDQHWTANGGIIVNDTHKGWFSLDGEYGSGLSQDPVNCPPAFDAINCKVPPHLIFGVEKGIGLPTGQLVFSVENMFNDTFAITLNNALQGTHYARPRTFGLRYVFSGASR